MFPQSQEALKVLLALKEEEGPKHWRMKENEALWVHNVHLELKTEEELMVIWLALADEPQVETPSFDQSLSVKAVYHQIRNSIEIHFLLFVKICASLRFYNDN